MLSVYLSVPPVKTQTFFSLACKPPKYKSKINKFNLGESISCAITMQ